VEASIQQAIPAGRKSPACEEPVDRGKSAGPEIPPPGRAAKNKAAGAV
jgi:hypothetical protein